MTKDTGTPSIREQNRIFKRLSADILDRRGLKWEWEKIDRDVMREIREAWRVIIWGARTKTAKRGKP